MRLDLIITAVIALLPVGFILVMSEYLWRKKVVKGERARKFIHILAGIHIAFWSHYVPIDGIVILGGIALTILLYSRQSKLFTAIYQVKRRTYGEILFAVAIIISAVLAQEPWVFTVAILLLALADGGAAVVGRFWGMRNQYFVFGSPSLRKSVAGTLAYIVFAYACIAAGWFVGGSKAIESNFVISLVVLPLIAALLENITPYGFDNIAIPIFASLLLNSLI